MKKIVVYLIFIVFIIVVCRYSPRQNINTCTFEYLVEIDGIGEVLADRIIDHRPIRCEQDIINIDGIGEILLERITTRVAYDNN